MNLLGIDLAAKTAVELRKLGAEAGIKGASKGKKAELLAALEGKQSLQVKLAEQENARKHEELAKGASQYDDSDEAKKARRSRRGMVIVAKGTEVHKSETFRAAAEANGWKVDVTRTTEVVEEDDEEFEIELYVATATQGDDSILLAWEGRAYNYPESGAVINGKARKVRNLKEALRFLVISE